MYIVFFCCEIKLYLICNLPPFQEEPEEIPVTPVKGSLPKQQKPRKAIVKIVSAAPVPNPPTPPKVIRERKPSVVAPPSKLTIPHPPTEPIRAQKAETLGTLPYFITQFKGEGWFDSHFPDCSVEVCVTRRCFVKGILQSMKGSQY